MVLDPLFFKPKSIAVVGASENFSKIGGRPLKYLIKFNYQGKIFPVNPSYKSVGGFVCYPSLLDIPEKVDMALITIPAESVLKVIEQFREKNVKYAIVFSSGFAEVGSRGQKAQEELRRVGENMGIRFCGPNCAGVVNFVDQIPMAISSFLEAKSILPGDIGFITQSGAIGSSVVNRAQSMGIGFSYYISTGNEADLEISDFIDFMTHDPHTHVIMTYIEGIKDGARFLRSVDQAARGGKPIIVLKVGRSEAGRKAAASHTGSLAGSDVIYDAVFRQKGLVRVDDLDELFEVASVFSKCQLPKGEGLGIISTSGGAAALIADQCKDLNLKIADLSEETKEKLSEVLPPFATVSNPLDITAGIFHQPETLKKSLDLFSQDKAVALLLVAAVLTTGSTVERIARDSVEVSNSIEKPLVFLGTSGNLVNKAYEILEKSKVPFFRQIGNCLKSIKSLMRYREFLQRMDLEPEKSPSVEPQKAPMNKGISELLNSPSGALTEYESKEVLRYYEIPIPGEYLVRTIEEAVERATEIGFPIALKVMTPEILHKTDAGVVRLNVRDNIQLRRGYEELMENTRSRGFSNIQGILVQEMVEGGTEVIVGMSQDPQFGPIVMFGLGGIFVEVFRDVSFRIPPITSNEARRMIMETRGYRILEGLRGRPRSDVESIIDIIMKVSQLSLDLRESISEIDINPLMVLEEGRGSKAIDARIILKRSIS